MDPCFTPLTDIVTVGLEGEDFPPGVSVETLLRIQALMRRPFISLYELQQLSELIELESNGIVSVRRSPDV